MTLIKLREAVVLLEQSGILGSETKQKEQAVKRLLNQGLILGEQPPKNQPKLGWKVDLDSLNEYIQIGNLKKPEMVKELIELRRKVRDLEFRQVRMNDDVPLEENIQSLQEGDLATQPAEMKQENKEEKKKLSDSVSEVPKEHDFIVSKLNIIEKQNARTYKVAFVLNKEPFEGIVSTEYNLQFVEIWNERVRYVLGEIEEQSQYLEALAMKMAANVSRKIKTFDKKPEQK